MKGSRPNHATLLALTALLAAVLPGPARARDEAFPGDAASTAEISTVSVSGAGLEDLPAPAAPALSSGAPSGLEVSTVPAEVELSSDTHRPVLFLDEVSQGLSIFNSLFTGIDKLISGQEATSANKTSMNLSFRSVVGRYMPLKNEPRADMRIDMPSTLHRLKLIIEHAPAEDGSVSASEERIARGQTPSEGTTLGGKYSLFSGRHFRQDLHVGSRLMLSRSRIYRIFAKFRVGAQADFWGAWRSIVFTQAGWFSDPWLELSGGVYFSRALPRRATLSINSSAEKTTLARKIDIFESVAVVKQVGRLDSVGLALQLHSVTVPYNRAELYAVVLAYRRNLYNGWMFGEISPAMEYPREHSFKPAPGISGKINMYFGYTKQGKK
ncbi:MAG: hypothetical protein M0011_10750 [Elusimicrobia bacterium]|nr:hypothetical protein [Elusimicrobiota bacterium]